MIRFFTKFFRIERSDITKTFDKAHRKLEVYLQRTEAEHEAAMTAAKIHEANLIIGSRIKETLKNLTSVG